MFNNKTDSFSATRTQVGFKACQYACSTVFCIAAATVSTAIAFNSASDAKTFVGGMAVSALLVCATYKSFKEFKYHNKQYKKMRRRGQKVVNLY